MRSAAGIRQRARGERGFTLIELAVVIAIIAILAAAAVPTYKGVVQRSHKAEAQNVISEIRSLAWQYYLEKGAWPSTGDVNQWGPQIGFTNPGGKFTYSLYTPAGTTNLGIEAVGSGAANGMKVCLELDPNGAVVGGDFKYDANCP